MTKRMKSIGIKLSEKQKYIFGFMTHGGLTATVAGNRIQFGIVDRGPASVMYALERKGLVEQLPEANPGYSKIKHYRAVSQRPEPDCPRCKKGFLKWVEYVRVATEEWDENREMVQYCPSCRWIF